MALKRALFLIAVLFISIEAKNILEFDINSETKGLLQLKLELIKDISRKANDFIITVNAQMEAFNASSQFRLDQLEGKVVDELNKISKNEEYGRCVEPYRKDLKVIVQKNRAELNPCYRNAVKDAEGVRNETVKSFNNLEIYEFVENCLEKQLKDGCSENEAQRILKDTEKPIEVAYRKLFSSVSDVLIIVEEAKNCFKHKEDDFLIETEKFLAIIEKKCIIVQ